MFRCAGRTEDDRPMQFRMDNRQKHATLNTPLCLEDGKRYQIKLKFDQHDPNSPDPKASILIDSVSYTRRRRRKPFFSSIV